MQQLQLNCLEQQLQAECGNVLVRTLTVQIVAKFREINPLLQSLQKTCHQFADTVELHPII